MWWILGGLIALIAWALKLVFDWPLWIPITATVVVVVSLLGIFITRKLLARRAAGALEKRSRRRATSKP